MATIYFIRHSEALKNIDVVFSSNYVRAIGTAKYFAVDKINIDERFGERKFGINSWAELPADFEVRQFNDFNYKIGIIIRKKKNSLNSNKEMKTWIMKY